MHKTGERANKGNGRWFSFVNEDLSRFEIVASLLVVFSLLLFPIQARLFPSIPHWAFVACFGLSALLLFVATLIKTATGPRKQTTEQTTNEDPSGDM